MNKLILTAMAGIAIASSALFSACDKDKNEVLPNLKDNTYSDTALDIEYNGIPLTGKYAKLSTNPADSKSAIISMGSVVNLAQFSDALKGLPEVPGAGVLPGTPLLSLPVSLIPDGDEYTFSGKGETDFVTYSYEGDIKENELDVDLDNVMLKNQVLGNTGWKLAPIQKGTDGSFSSLPFHIVWEGKVPGLESLVDSDIQQLLQLITTLPIIPVYNGTAYMSPAQAISSSVQSLGFNRDGNLVVTYLQTVNGAAQFAQAPQCMLQYVPLSNNILKVYVNPLDLIGQILVNGSTHPTLPPNPFGKNSRSASSLAGILTPETIMPIFKTLAPMLSQGMPMEFSRNGNMMAIYLNTQTLEPLVQNIIMPLLSNPEVQQLILSKLQLSTGVAPVAVKMQELFKNLPQIIAATTRIELGINLVQIK